MAITVAGTVFQSDGVTPDLSGVTLNISVNGAASAASTTSSAVDGTYLFAGIVSVSADVLTVYLQGNTPVGVTVTKSTGLPMTGIDVVESALTIRSDQSKLTAANINTSKTNGATGITSVYSATATTLTVASGNNLILPSGHAYDFTSSTTNTWTVQSGAVTIAGTLTYTGGATQQLIVTAGSVTVSGTVARNNTSGTCATNISAGGLTVTGSFTNAGTLGNGIHNVTVSGSFTNSGSISVVAGTWSLTGTVTGAQTIDTGGITVTLAVNNASGTYTLQRDTTCASVTLTNGTLNDGGFTITVNGNWSKTSGALSATGTVTFSDANHTLTRGTVFKNLTLSAATARTLTFTAGTAQAVTVTGTLTLNGASGQLLSLRSSSTGQQWFIAAAAVSLGFLDVKDGNNASGYVFSPGNSVDSGNNVDWFSFAPPPQPFAPLRHEVLDYAEEL